MATSRIFESTLRCWFSKSELADCAKLLVSVRLREDVGVRSLHIGVSGKSIGEYAQPWNAVGTEVGIEVGGVFVYGADGLDVGIGADGLNLSFHQLSVLHRSESSVTWTVLAISFVNEAAEGWTLGLEIKVGDALLI